MFLFSDYTKIFCTKELHWLELNGFRKKKKHNVFRSVQIPGWKLLDNLKSLTIYTLSSLLKTEMSNKKLVLKPQKLIFRNSVAFLSKSGLGNSPSSPRPGLANSPSFPSFIFREGSIIFGRKHLPFPLLKLCSCNKLLHDHATWLLFFCLRWHWKGTASAIGELNFCLQRFSYFSSLVKGLRPCIRNFLL